MSTPAISSATDTTVDQNAQAHHWNNWGVIKAFAFRLLITYFIFNLFRKPPQNQMGLKQANLPATNVFEAGTSMDLYIYLSESDTFYEFNKTNALFWYQPSIIYGDWTAGQNSDGSYSKTGTIDCSQFPKLMHNGTLYLHVFIVKSGYSPDPSTGDKYFEKFTIQKTKMLTRYKRRRLSRTVNLLTGQTDVHPDLRATDATGDNSRSNVILQDAITHWHPNLTINVVDDHSHWIQGSVPAPLNQFIEFYAPTNEYYPIVYLNDYWNLNEDYKPVNETTPTLTYHFTIAPISLFKWQLYAAQSVRKTWFTQILGENMLQSDVQDDEEQDTLKKTLVETNPWLLALTAVISVVHSIFELLAFKNDIQFWKTRESLEGLSVRFVFFNVFQSLIVVLYVWDNDTNFVIKISVVLGLLIEVWKIKKVLVIQVDHTSPILGILPQIHISYQSSYVESDTKKYDQMAFQYLSWILFPMLAVYCGYSLLYQEHRGWYSWVLSIMYGFLLTFGFIMMTPQLFINYKMKSVAHLPWRMLTYKALNTFIDDLFAFVIKMPTLYRIGCLRDDVIFFIYLYQRWIYPMDPNRINEFGVSKQMLDSSASGATTTTTAALDTNVALSNGDVQSTSTTIKRTTVAAAGDSRAQSEVEEEEEDDEAVQEQPVVEGDRPEQESKVKPKQSPDGKSQSDDNQHHKGLRRRKK